VSYERVRDQLHQLKAEAALSALDPVLEQAQKAAKLTVQVLDELLGIELAARFKRCVTINLKLSGLPRSRAHREKNRLDSLFRVLTRPQILILDEIGYLPLEQPDATFLFEVVNKRYQAQKSIILTSNKGFGQSGEIFPDPVLAVALLDRLLHHATTLNIRGESYRLRHRRQAGLTTPSPSA